MTDPRKPVGLALLGTHSQVKLLAHPVVWPWVGQPGQLPIHRSIGSQPLSAAWTLPNVLFNLALIGAVQIVVDSQ
jgi:hypothetical protein